MYLIANLVTVIAFIASAAVGFYTYQSFATLTGLQRVGFVGLFIALTITWISARIWMMLNTHLRRGFRL